MKPALYWLFLGLNAAGFIWFVLRAVVDRLASIRLRRDRQLMSFSARIHTITDQALRRMLEESLRALGGQRLQGPTR